jgi:hypothetical protein
LGQPALPFRSSYFCERGFSCGAAHWVRLFPPCPSGFIRGFFSDLGGLGQPALPIGVFLCAPLRSL